jgi:hypothetical protein
MVRHRTSGSRRHGRRSHGLGRAIIHGGMFVGALFAAAGPSGAAGASPGAVSFPDSMVVIGHSGATGYDSDPAAPDRDTPANSWATGTNPDVASVYLQVLTRHPAIEGHATNLAVSGSDVVGLADQARDAVAILPAPGLVLVQSIDNDMRCDGTDAQNLPLFHERLLGILGTLTEGLPGARILFVSQWADVSRYSTVVAAIDPGHLAGDGPCDVIDPSSMGLEPLKEAGLQALVDDYFGVIVDACSRFPTCGTDGGAMQAMDLVPDDLAPDLDHLSIQGQRKMAGIAFRALFGPAD